LEIGDPGHRSTRCNGLRWQAFAGDFKLGNLSVQPEPSLTADVIHRYVRPAGYILWSAVDEAAMQLSFRMKRHAVPNSSNAGARNETIAREKADSAAEPPASFDDWLDGRLRTLYQTVVSEPLPDEILALLKEVDKSK
jgi:hypothetical protein